jgi:hypothetical protein
MEEMEGDDQDQDGGDDQVDDLKALFLTDLRTGVPSLSSAQRDDIYNFLESKKGIYDCQFGFIFSLLYHLI